MSLGLENMWRFVARTEAREIYGNSFLKHQAEYCHRRVQELEAEYTTHLRAVDLNREDDRLFGACIQKIRK